MFDKFKNKKKFYIASFNQRRIIIRKCWIFIENADCKWTFCYFIQHIKVFNCDNRQFWTSQKWLLSILRYKYARLWYDIKIFLIKKHQFKYLMIWSHLNLSRRLNNADETIEHLNNECWKLYAICYVYNKEKRWNLCCVIILNVIHRKFKKVCKLQSCALRNSLN